MTQDDVGTTLEEHEAPLVNGFQKWVPIVLQLMTLVAVVAVGWGAFSSHVNNGHIHQDPDQKRELARDEALKVYAPLDRRMGRVELMVDQGQLPLASQRIGALETDNEDVKRKLDTLLVEIAEIKALLKNGR